MELEFNKLTLDCMDSLRQYFVDNQCRICDCTVGSTFMWRDFHNTEYAVEDGILYLKVTHPELAFGPPRGYDVNKSSYERIISYCDSIKAPTMIRSVSHAVYEHLLEMFPGSEARTDRAWSDYLYLASDMKNLEGRKYSGQRNHINRFMREYPAWNFERITAENKQNAAAFIEKNARENIKDSPIYNEGTAKALEVLDNLDHYKQFGGILYAGNEVVGVSLGELVDDTLYIHTEKADVSHHGSYPMLMNQFANSYSTEETVYINREEDDGVEGLRTSKLALHPVELLDKYKVLLK